jgi:dihydrofolate reductase
MAEGRVFAHISMSVDGYIADAAGGLGWWSTDEEFNRYIDGVLDSIDGMVLGRVAYDELGQFWPTAGPEMSATQRRRMHELPKYVLSRTRAETDWHNSHVLGPDPAAAIRDAARDVGGDVAVTAALGFAVLDELRLVIQPALVGSGIRLFDSTHPTRALRLLDTTPFARGVLVVRYTLDPTTGPRSNWPDSEVSP